MRNLVIVPAKSRKDVRFVLRHAHRSLWVLKREKSSLTENETFHCQRQAVEILLDAGPTQEKNQFVSVFRIISILTDDKARDKSQKPLSLG